MGFMAALLMAVVALASCTSEAYDSGDGKYSYLRADFGRLKVDADKNVRSIETDGGDQLTVANPFTAAWMQVADTAYRALLYYSLQDAADGQQQANVVTAAQVYVLLPVASELVELVKSDPVTFESAWTSAGGKYLNLGFLVKTGTADGDDSVQTIGLIDNGVATSANGTTCRRLQFYHDQGGVPEYYSVKRYASILLSDFREDSVSITVQSYNGLVERQFAVPALDD